MIEPGHFEIGRDKSDLKLSLIKHFNVYVLYAVFKIRTLVYYGDACVLI